MAQLTVFEYRAGTSFLHQQDVRCKITSLILINALAFNATHIGLIVLSGLLILMFLQLRISILTTLRNLRLLFLILVFVLGTRSIYTQGDPLFQFGFLVITGQGLQSGAVYCWRLITLFLAGIIFVSSTGITEIKSGIQWFLKPLPGIPERKVAVMISLMVRFLPLVLQQAGEISEAQKSRGAEIRKNPVKRLTLFSVPLFRRVFETADRLVLAMESRCFSENRTDPQMKLKSVDLISMVILFVLGIIIFTL